MAMSRFSRRERTQAPKKTLVYNASGTYPVPYGKAVLRVTGQGAPGTAGTQYYVVDTPGHYATEVDVPGHYQTVVDRPGYTYYVVDRPESYSTSYLRTEVHMFQRFNTYGEEEDFYTYNTTGACPSPYYTVARYTYYQCTNEYTTTYTPATYKQAWEPTTYKQEWVAPTYRTYWVPTTYESRWYSPQKGGDAVFGGVTFPGGYGGAASPLTVNVAIPKGASSMPVTAPSGSSVSISTI